MKNNAGTNPDQPGAILIIGGYGQVGHAIATRLAPLFPAQVIVAGRNAGKAGQAAAAIGHGARARAIDVFSPVGASALDDVALVLMCLDQQETGFVEKCLARGIHYADISADAGLLTRVETLDGLARAHAATAVLSVGVSPGLTNMLARRAVETCDRVARIDILLELGIGDRHGRAALAWMFDNLDTRFAVREDGRMRQVQSFGESRLLRLPGQANPRPAYRFSFPDQQVVAQNTQVPSVSTWIRFDSRAATWLFAFLARHGLPGLLRRWGWLRRAMLWLFMNVHVGSDICGVAVNVETPATGDAVIGVIGRREAEMTAIVAAETLRQMMTGSLAGGVFHADQVIGLDGVIAALQREQPDMTTRL